MTRFLVLGSISKVSCVYGFFFSKLTLFFDGFLQSSFCNSELTILRKKGSVNSGTSVELHENNNTNSHGDLVTKMDQILGMIHGDLIHRYEENENAATGMMAEMQRNLTRSWET